MSINTEDNIYHEALTAIVQHFMKLVGPCALHLARCVYGLQVEEDGSVTGYQGDGWVTMQGLVIEYMTVLGPEAVPMALHAITPMVTRNPNVKLPTLFT